MRVERCAGAETLRLSGVCSLITLSDTTLAAAGCSCSVMSRGLLVLEGVTPGAASSQRANAGTPLETLPFHPHDQTPADRRGLVGQGAMREKPI